MQRIFLVGCPRSGTTIVQSLLAAHPEIVTFPETKIFQYTLWDSFKDRLSKRLNQFFNDEIKRPEILEEFDGKKGTAITIKWFLAVLDKLTLEENKNIWLEKTPEHIYFVQDILNYLPEAKFIHVVRYPLDVVASMREATKTPLSNTLWGGEWTLEFCVKRWQDAALINHAYSHQPEQHLVVRYEDLLWDKTAFLSKCCHFIGVEFDYEMLTNYKAEALRLGLRLPWHEAIDRDVAPAIAPKYQSFLGAEEVRYILGKTEELRSCFGYANPDPENSEPGLNK